jgi:hypothetical protein
MVGFTTGLRGKVPGKTCEKRRRNSIQFFIISVLHQQPEGQLQMQHTGRQNNKCNKITTIRL